MSIQIVTVTGSRPFPIDMLRYDACRPCDQESTGEIENSIRHDVPCAQDIPYTVRLLYTNQRPTHGRWESFGWTVTEVRERGY